MASRPYLAFRVVLSLYVGLCLALDSTISFSGSVVSAYPANFAQALSPSSVLWFAGGCAGSYVVLLALQRALERLRLRWGAARRLAGQTSAESPSGGIAQYMRANVRWLALSFACVFAGWLLVWLNYWPGTSMNDQLWLIDDPIPNGSSHPVLYNLVLSYCVRFGVKILGSGSCGFALYAGLQMAVCAGIVAFCAVWLRYRHAPKWASAAFVAVFALTPIISNYAICAIKDTPFSYFLLLLIPFLFEAATQRGFWERRSSYLAFAAIVMLVSLSRNNGLYLMVALSLVLVVVFRKVAWRRIALTALLALVVASVPSALVSAAGHQHLFRETVGVPLQQICAVVCEDGESLTDEQRNYIGEIIPLETVQAVYAPMAVDAIKYNGQFNTDYLQETKSRFVEVYIQLGLSHPGIYWRALLSQTWGYWSLTAWDTTQSFFFEISDNLKTEELALLAEKWELENHALYPDALSQAIDSAYQALVRVYPGPGLCFALVLVLGFALVVAGDNRRLALCAVPCVLLWLTLLLSAPLSCSLRYAFPMLIAIPLLAVLVLAQLHTGGEGIAGNGSAASRASSANIWAASTWRANAAPSISSASASRRRISRPPALPFAPWDPRKPAQNHNFFFCGGGVLP